jgi:hypothetical protein
VAEGLELDDEAFEFYRANSQKIESIEFKVESLIDPESSIVCLSMSMRHVAAIDN